MEDARIPIEEFIQFPTRHTFKAIGHHTRKFSEDVRKAARRVMGEERTIELRTRLSAKAAYVSVSVAVNVESAHELHATYAALRALEGIITVL